MISVLGWLLGLLAIIVLVPVLVLVLQVLLACLPARSRPKGIGERPRVAVLVPAHDEALVIRAMLASVTPQLLDGDRLLVMRSLFSPGAVLQSRDPASGRFDLPT